MECETSADLGSALVSAEVNDDKLTSWFHWQRNLTANQTTPSGVSPPPPHPPDPQNLQFLAARRRRWCRTGSGLAPGLIFHPQINRKTDVLPPCTLGNQLAVMRVLLTAAN